MRPRGQRGASLIIVMAFMILLATIVPALLGLASTGLAVTRPVVADRRELYAATSALEAAVQVGNIDPDVGVAGGPCPNTSTEVDGFAVDVECQAHPAPLDGCHYLDRFVTYTAEVRRSGQSEVLTRVATEVVYRFDVNGAPRTEVRQWNANAESAVPTTALPSCSATPPVTPP